ncbi:MAG TPA: TetR/AcrR family transcriptional regulator [Candidatus Tectomicrobia bacterium]|jgi:TetR/AcrR family transcriptional regulator, transcriptional repressor for nem operon|nr:TetR/AcrR family transcriptional regulator [Candidatus Tectomicrobia bacterium]
MPRVSDMKERLMEAAMDLMWQNSYSAASVDAICERAGAKKGSFYYFFKSKSELAAAALEADWKKKRVEMDSIFSPTIPPLERFDRYFDFVYDRLAEVQKKCGSILGCPFMSVGSEVSTQDQIVRGAIDRIMDRKLQFFVSAVRDAASEGLIETTDPVAKAQALFSSYQGTIAQARIQNDIDLIRDFKHVAREVLGVKRAAAVTT